MVPNIRRNVLLKALGLKSKLPPDYQRIHWNVVVQDNGITYGPFTVTVKPMETPGKRTHRIKILCPKCRFAIPAGRYGQHYDSGICKRYADL